MCIIPEKHIVYQHMYLGLQGNFFNKKSKIQKQTKASWVYGGGCGGKSGGGGTERAPGTLQLWFCVLKESTKVYSFSHNFFGF